MANERDTQAAPGDDRYDDYEDAYAYDPYTSSYGAYGFGVPPYAIASNLSRLGYALARSRTQTAVGISQIIGGVLTSLIDAAYVSAPPFQAYGMGMQGYGYAGAYGPGGYPGAAPGPAGYGAYDQDRSRPRPAAAAGRADDGRRYYDPDHPANRRRPHHYGYGPGAATGVVTDGMNRAVADALRTFSRAAEDFAYSYTPPPPPQPWPPRRRRDAAPPPAEGVRSAGHEAAQSARDAASRVESSSPPPKKP